MQFIMFCFALLKVDIFFLHHSGACGVGSGQTQILHFTTNTGLTQPRVKIYLFITNLSAKLCEACCVILEKMDGNPVMSGMLRRTLP